MLLKLIASKTYTNQKLGRAKKSTFLPRKRHKILQAFACRLYPSHGPLRFITSHSFRARLCHAKNEAPAEEAVIETQSLFKKGRKFGFSEWPLHAYLYTF